MPDSRPAPAGPQTDRAATGEDAVGGAQHRAPPTSDAQLRAIKDTSTVWYWEQDADFRFTLDQRGRDHTPDQPSVVGIRRWESRDSAPLQGTWEDHKRWVEARLPFRDFEFRVGTGPNARYISTNGVPVYAPDGSFAGYRGTAMDVTELKNAREASERAQSFLRLASRLGRVAAWSIEVPGMRASWSRDFLQLIGFAPSQVPSVEDVFGLVHPRLQGQVSRAWNACVHTGAPFDLEVQIRTPSGRGMWMRLLGEAARDPGGAIHRIQGAAQDISESKEDRERLRSLGEQLSAANAELTGRVRERTRDLELVNSELKGFAHALAHDLKQPIVAMQWFSTALDEAIARGDLAQSALLSERIQDAGVRMQDYVDALLSLAETSQAPLNMTDVDLSAIADIVLDELQARDTGRRLVRDIEPGLLVRGDRRLLQMLLQNLLGNAWKFTARRDEAHITLKSGIGEAGETVYSVQDNGAGFDMAHAGKLFGNFQRLHAGSEFAGTGVGLANVQRIVIRHGGRIWGSSRLGEGATFSFTLGDSAQGGAGHPV